MNSYRQTRSHLVGGRLLAWLLLTACLPLAACFAPAAHGEGWQFWPFNKEDKPGKPDKVVTIWSDTVLTQAGQPAIRGFGGRLMFYQGKNEEPIKVDGTLVVFAFDETNRDANDARPDRKYIITQQQLPLHYSKSKVGHSYSVWVPWDAVDGGMQKEITLIVRFQPKEKEAPAVVSDPCRQLLPGRVETARAQVPAGLYLPAGPVGPMQAGAGNWGNGPMGMPPPFNGGVQPAAYQAPISDGPNVMPPPGPERRIMTTTIDVPSGSVLRSALSLPQAPAAGGPYQTGAGQNYQPNYPVPNYQPQSYPAQNYQPQSYPAQNYQPPSYPAPNYPRDPRNSGQNYPPQGYAPPPATPSSASSGLQLRVGFAPGRQWPLGEPLARLNRDRAPSAQPLEGSPTGLASQPGQIQGQQNAPPAGPQGVPQAQY
jgi:hypothetical protein